MLSGANVRTAATLTQLAQAIDITTLLIPPSAYLRDRDVTPNIHTPDGTSSRRAFSARPPLPRSLDGTSRLPRVLRETTSFILLNLTTEGLFRIPCHVKVKEILREAYDRGQRYIIWKERGVTLPLPQHDILPHYDSEAMLKEIDQSEAYGIHTAAGVCKFWYSELRDPIFPATSYKNLHKLFPAGESASVEQVTELLSPASQWSIISAQAREILTRHLLPLLSAIAAHSEENKMTPDNLAVCFAPTLCCGPDQLEDAKVSGVIRRVLAQAIELWPQGLREACGTTEAKFEANLKAPERAEDYEDPAPVGSTSSDHGVVVEAEKSDTGKEGFTAEQETGILLRDNDTAPTTTTSADKKEAPTTAADSSPSDAPRPPQLPPRRPASPTPSTSTSTSTTLPAYDPTPPILPPRNNNPNPNIAPSSLADPLTLRRKEVPPVSLATHLPPRYSQVVTTSSSAVDDGISESPSTYMTPANGFAPERRGDWRFDVEDDGAAAGGEGKGMVGRDGPERQDSQFRRKPVGSGDSYAGSAGSGGGGGGGAKV